MDKETQKSRAEAFAVLHRKGDPLKLFNIWDAASAGAVARAGAPAIATSSFAVALAHGTADGENLPLDKLVAAVSEIAPVVDLPLTADIETGYGATPDDVAASVARILGAGAVLRLARVLRLLEGDEAARVHARVDRALRRRRAVGHGFRKKRPLRTLRPRLNPWRTSAPPVRSGAWPEPSPTGEAV